MNSRQPLALFVCLVASIVVAAGAVASGTSTEPRLHHGHHSFHEKIPISQAHIRRGSVSPPSPPSAVGLDRLLQQHRRFGSLSKSSDCPNIPILPKSFPSPIPPAIQKFFDEYSANVTEAVRQAGTKSLHVTMVYDQSIVFQQGFGKVDPSNVQSPSPNGDTVYRIGSLTKVFTDLMLLMLRDEGKVTLDSLLTTLLPEFRIQNPFPPMRGITLRQLGSHTAGMPREAPCTDMFTKGCQMNTTETLNRIAEEFLIFPPAASAAYSNLGVAMLGRSLERAAGMSWEQFLISRILNHLNMTRTFPSQAPATSDKNVAIGYESPTDVAGWIDLGYQSPAGQSFSSGNDLAQLMKLVFRYDSAHGLANSTFDQILDSETIREWFQQVYAFPTGIGFGMPWEQMDLNGYRFQTKAGSINGYLAQFTMIPDLKWGVILLQSDAFTETISEAHFAFISSMSLIESAFWAIQSAPTYPANLLEYVGTYEADLYSGPAVVNMTITELNGFKYLAIQSPMYPVPLVLDWHPEVSSECFQPTVRFVQEIACEARIFGTQQYIFFIRTENITGFTIPGEYWGVMFRRTSK